MKLIAVIECPECNSDNPLDSPYCCGCGCELPQGSERVDCIVYLVDWERKDDPMEIFEEETES